jgi:transposase-like protein
MHSTDTAMTITGEQDPITTVAMQADSDEIARAFGLWAADPDHNAAEVARVTGRSENTIRAWKRKYQWEKRLVDMQSELLGVAPDYLRVRMAEGIDIAVETLVTIMQSSDVEARDRLAAVRILAGIVAPAQGPVVQVGGDHRSVVLNGIDIRNPQDVARALAQAANDNIQATQVHKK